MGKGSLEVDEIISRFISAVRAEAEFCGSESPRGTCCRQAELETPPHTGDLLRAKGKEPGLLAAESLDTIVKRGLRTAELGVTMSGPLAGGGQEIVGVVQALAVARSL